MQNSAPQILRGVLRTDRGSVTGPLVRTPSGGVRVPARIMHVGVLEYPEDGTRELVLPEELYSRETMESLRGVPVTDLHPRERAVRGDNWSRHARGHVEDPTADAEWLAGMIHVAHPELIAKIERGSRREISAGYTEDLEIADGDYFGQPYNRIKRRIRFNHVAIGPPNWARAGSGARLQIDGRFQNMRDFQIDGRTLKIDGRPFDLTDAGQRAAAIEVARSSLAVRCDEADPAAVKAALDEIQGLAQSLTEQLVTLAALFAEEAPDMSNPEMVAEMVPDSVLDSITARRAGALFEVYARARNLAPAVKVDGKSAAQVMREVLTARGIDVTAANDDFVRGRFAGLAPSTFSDADSAAIRGDGGAALDSDAAARERRRKKQQERFAKN